MKILNPLVAVVGLALVALLGANLGSLVKGIFGLILPWAAFLAFIIFFIKKIIDWAKVPVPFRIPTTCGQQKSLPWIKQNKIDCPSDAGGVILRMALEVLCFRSLFRNTKAEIHDGPQLVYGSSKWLWLFSIIFHYSFLVVVIRHMRLFTDPMPFFVPILEFGDGIMQLGVPVLYMSGVGLVMGTTALLFRRFINPQVRYISLAADYFPLFLILGIAISGILMRYFVRVDITAVKGLTVFLANPISYPFPALSSIGAIFFVHVFLVCTLLVYFPFSKLMHMGGIFLSPTRNLANNSRMVRHINPWNDPNLKPHSYEAYEDDFRDVMKAA
ncbi:MAG: sulfate reduction electron transfer complex DsrMKJOP subunit DsrM, partial [Desulfobulbaceae bacterium]|nr:sulfate reduction electron transfer complex DsrMKJOP subunit DsrM [Desulfobulbaceae bacterium]